MRRDFASNTSLSVEIVEGLESLRVQFCWCVVAGTVIAAIEYTLTLHHFVLCLIVLCGIGMRVSLSAFKSNQLDIIARVLRLIVLFMIRIMQNNAVLSKRRL